jgi:hypothetical protein
MLKQILATSALIAIAAVSVQSASAADTTKFRQIVVQPVAIASADADLLKKKKLQPLLRVQPGHGIPTPGVIANAGNGNSQAGKIAEFAVAPGQGIPTPAAGDAGGKGKPQNNLPAIAALPGGGIPTPITVADGGADPGAPAGSKAFPSIVAAPSGIATPASDPGAGAATPSADAAASPAGVPPAIASPAADAGAPAASAGGGQPGQPGADSGAAAAFVPPAAPIAPTAASAVQSPSDLYSLLTGRGYGVEILKRDQYGNLVFYVTVPGQSQEADLLLVDGTYGKVLDRKHIAAYGYDHPASYAPSYAAAYAGDANCNHAASY